MTVHTILTSFNEKYWQEIAQDIERDSVGFSK